MNASPQNNGLCHGNSHSEPPMIGDFEGSANALWTLFGEQAERHDKATIQTLKEDMDGLLIFVCSYSVYAYGFSHADP
jgi:hypothetical protein